MTTLFLKALPITLKYHHSSKPIFNCILSCFILVANGVCKWPQEWIEKYLVLSQIQNVILDDSKEDIMVWRNKEGKEGNFSVNQAYYDLLNDSDKVKWYKTIWFSQNIPKHAFVFWMAVKNKLLTQDKMEKWGSYDMMKLNLTCTRVFDGPAAKIIGVGSGFVLGDNSPIDFSDISDSESVVVDGSHKGPPTPLTPLERYNSQYANFVMLLSRCGTIGRLGDWLKWSVFAIGSAALVSMALYYNSRHLDRQSIHCFTYSCNAYLSASPTNRNLSAPEDVSSVDHLKIIAQASWKWITLTVLDINFQGASKIMNCARHSNIQLGHAGALNSHINDTCSNIVAQKRPKNSDSSSY
ncbi:RNA-directed DNA polymerase, eukaryota, Reverse transcriptase zinc-binding domain protein [Artemisia annua]|uniref:RNA-directed DNA polymerase, eukaryota, Reverse transcriptase zinc-binding domain protein n=1 Tax=Artemisia annua TaxID=35608 RepID=A0A2U1LB85_ARTAN|nr:RNA-directed DNA polymerase, eukaryota, Reverse transcriptase zinc-binding domain protein [Artemisia annua]